jgi:hypothetical protein
MSDLLKINVNDHTEKKNGLTYLSWAWAWAEVLKLDPQATWYAHEYGPQGSEVPYMQLPDGSCMVRVTVTIKQHPKACLLPVMNHKNQAIKGPDAFQVNTAIMRCLAKAISMHGLGLYIYAGEDLPEQEVQVTTFDITEALNKVEACTSVPQLEAVWKTECAKAAAAQDKGGYAALKDAVKEKKASFTEEVA